jgi:cell division protein FtsL
MSPRGRPTVSAGWAGEPGDPRQHAARFHRESDRGRLRAMAAALAGVGLVVALVLGVVGLRVQHVRLSYRLEGLRAARAELEEGRSRLRVELATLRSLARIDGKARTELGMVQPGREQVRLAREFVPDANGLAARAPLTASVESEGAGQPARGTR